MTKHLLKFDSPIYNLQIFLRTIANEYPSIPSVLPDGYYGDTTVKAVIAFQNMHNLSPTGITDNSTWNKIVSIYEEIERKNTVNRVGIYPEEGYFNENNNSIPTIYIIQVMLNALSEKFSNLISVDVNGKEDDATKNAISTLQTLGGQKADGNITIPFMNLLFALYEAYVSQDRVNNKV